MFGRVYFHAHHLLDVSVGGLVTFGSGHVSSRCGRGYVIVFGLLAWTVPALCDMLRRSFPATLEIAPYGIILSYLGYGIGRGAFDSAFRALCACLFPHRLEQIFALTRFGEGAAASIAFSICPCEYGVPINAMLVAMGSIAMVTYYIAERINGFYQGPEEPAAAILRAEGPVLVP